MFDGLTLQEVSALWRMISEGFDDYYYSKRNGTFASKRMMLCELADLANELHAIGDRKWRKQ